MTKGLTNLGNTCYMNSIIQVLLNTNLFTRALMIEKDSENELVMILKKIFVAMNDKDIDTISPKTLRRFIMKTFIIFNNNGQHDAYEFLLNILDYLHNNTGIKEGITNGLYNIKKKISIKEWNNYHNNKKSYLVNKLFYGQFIKKIHCISCKTITEKYDPFISLQINKISKDCNISDMISNYFNIEFNIKKNCEKCNSTSNHIIDTSIYKLPKILILNNMSKMNFIIEKIIDLNNYHYSNNNKSDKYILKSIVCYTGNSINGHYYTVIIKESSFLIINDSHIIKINKLENINPYILFYERISD